MLKSLSPATFQSVIDVAERQESPLGKAIAEALQVIGTILPQERQDTVAISFNGGKDCTVILHLLAVCLWRQRIGKAPENATTESASSVADSHSNAPIKAIYITCSSPFSEVEAFVDLCAISYNLDLVRTNPGGLPMKEALKQYKETEPTVKSILVGTRRDDPHGAKLAFCTPTDEGWPAFIRVHPIINWTYGQIWEYLRDFGVPYCELYNQGYTSLGSTFNTFPNPALREDSGKYRPAYELKDGREERYGRVLQAVNSPTL